jgi:DNA-binding XRE family transcriptional regulator
MTTRLQADLGRLVHELRRGARLTQAALAKRICCRKSIIGQLEAGDYEGDLLTKLSLIVKACGKKLQLVVAS